MFETALAKKLATFQLHLRGVIALEQALQHRGSVGPDDKLSGITREGCTRGDPPNPTGLWREAGTYLLRTRGAELADMLTAHQCNKLVRARRRCSLLGPSLCFCVGPVCLLSAPCVVDHPGTGLSRSQSLAEVRWSKERRGAPR